MLFSTQSKLTIKIYKSSNVYLSKIYGIFCSLVLMFPALVGMWQSHVFKFFDQFIFSTMMQRVAYFHLESGFKQTWTELNPYEINKPACM